MKQGTLAIMGLLMVSACSVGPRTSSLNNTQIAFASSDSCSALGYTPGSAQYDQCMENNRIREEIVGRKAFNGNKNQPDGVMASTYDRRMGISINCTSYKISAPGSAPSLCN